MQTSRHLLTRTTLENVDALFKAITTSQGSIHHLLASRALLRARLQLWDEALVDAITVLVTVAIFSHLYRTCDIASVSSAPRGLSTAHPPWAIIVFMAGEHPDAISHLNDLIATTRPCATCYHAANIATDVFLETRRWNVMTTRVQCIRSRARAQMQGDVGPPLFAISLISGWEFDLLDILIRQRLCEAFLQDCTHHQMGFCLQTLPNNVSRASKTLVSQLRTHSSMTPIPLLREWEKATLFVVPRFTTSTLSAVIQPRLSAHGDAASNTNRDANMSTIHTTLPPLLREWAKAKLTRGSWKDALLSAVGVSISFCCPYELGIEIVGLQFTVSRVEIYRVVIEHDRPHSGCG
ncbi:hypothetical protein L210DRAFT_3552762 [Boletus edulis BED1]|uniref:Uncharacterized protein n=1 Tax=Boletus edulis BED1 TaxID=1328754 RepID=A0AAD4BMU3_BOLED|nr:hypothetical protein L210DRAFT_3552762 [Boletus edulis BED1]